MSNNSDTVDLQIQKVRVDGLALRVAVRPGSDTYQGPPMLVAGGMGANLELLTPFISALPDITLVLFDAPGIGESSTPLFPLSIPRLSNVLVKVMQQLGYANFDMLGLSWGGGLAQQLAYDNAQVCRRLLLAASSPGMGSVPGQPQVMQKMLSPRRFLDPDYMKSIAEQIYGGTHEQDREMLLHYLKQIRTGNSVGYFWQLYAMLGWSSIHWLHRITQPTLVMAGRNDPIIPLTNARMMANRIPNAELYTVDDGHLFMLTQAEDIAPVIMEFLNGVESDDLRA